MKDKYYTPEIEEFHVGFEYEMNYGYREWTYESTPFDFGMISDFISEGRCRVKYLDREDIESLGFIHVNGKVYNLPKTNISLWYNFSNVISSNSVTIRKIQGDMFFDVAIVPIKNKSELKRLLKQLEI